MQIKDITEADVKNKRVLLRTSLNVPVTASGEVSDMFRLKAAVPTIDFLSQHDAAVIIVAHLGRDGESLEPVVKVLSTLTKTAVRFFAGTLAEAAEESKKLQSGECIVLQNIRRDAREEKNDPALAQELALLGDIFVNDAFADSHRAHASIVGVAKLLPSYAGLLMQEEVTKLSGALTPPQGSLAIIGGAKFETKIPLLTKLVSLYGSILLGGALGNDMIKARGLLVGSSLVSSVPVPENLAGDERILMPLDAIATEKDSNAERSLLLTDTLATESIVDIGPRTIQDWAARVAAAPFVLWNGPMGIFEKGYTDGTDSLAQALVSAGVSAVIGGGDTAAAVSKINFDPAKVFISTGGGAMLEFLADGTLVGLEPLRK